MTDQPKPPPELDAMRPLLPIPVTEIIAALEREAGNTDTDPRWMAASHLRRMEGWQDRTLMCAVDERPEDIVTCAE